MDRSLCEQQADEVRKEYNPLNLTPFPYENVTTKNEELRVVFLDFSDEELLSNISGAIRYNTDSKIFTIYVNSANSTTRQNFTLAHELGHYFLHRDYLTGGTGIVDEISQIEDKTLYRSNNPEWSQREVEANNFAAALLMPADLVKQAWDDLGTIEACADAFGVSQVAMTIRLSNLGLIKA